MFFFSSNVSFFFKDSMLERPQCVWIFEVSFGCHCPVVHFLMAFESVSVYGIVLSCFYPFLSYVLRRTWNDTKGYGFIDLPGQPMLGARFFFF